MPRDLLVPLGLITRPGKLGAHPPGALSTAENVLLRTKGCLERVPDQIARNANVYGATQTQAPAVIAVARTSLDTTATSRTMAITAGSPSAFWDPNFSIAVWNPFPTAGGTGGAVDADRTLIETARSRWFINARNCIAVQDNLNPVAAAEYEPRLAGFPVPAVNVRSTAPATGSTGVPGNSQAAWTAIVRRRYADEYALTSPPASPHVSATPAVALNNVTVRVSLGAVVDAVWVAGDIVELYRTVTRAAGVDPGEQFYLSVSRALIAGDIIAGFVDLVDGVPDTNLGLDLYTNEGVEGADQTNDQPPNAASIAVYKDYMIYAGLTQPARLEFSFRMGSTVSGDPGRSSYVGLRSFSGTSAIGSPVITAVAAADIVGLRIGQFFEADPTKFNATANRVIAVGVATVTVNANAIGAGAAAHTTYDTLSVNGTEFIAFIRTNIVDALQVASMPVLAQLDGANGTGYTMTLQERFVGYDIFTIAATNGAVYSPPLPEISATPLTVSPINQPNAYQWSKEGFPEACPPLQIGYAGRESILRIVATQDATWFWCTDGLRRLTGSGGDWRLDPVDPELVLSNPRAAVSLRGTVYAFTNRGFVSVTVGRGVEELSNPILAELLGRPCFLSASTILSPRWLMVANEVTGEVWFSTDQDVGSTVTQRKFFWIYNTYTQAFTRAWVPYITTVVSGTVTASRDDAAVVAYDALNETLVFGSFLRGSIVPPVAAIYKNLVHSTTSFTTTTAVQFQPLYSAGSGLSKQWISAEYVFDPAADTLTITPTFASVTNPAVPVRGRGGGDCRASSYTPRAAFALNESMRVGYGSTASGQMKFYGVMPRFTPGSEQELQR